MADTSFSTKYSSSGASSSRNDAKNLCLTSVFADVEGRAALLTSLASSLSQNEPPQDLEQYVAALSDSLHSPHHALPLASLKALPAFFRTLEQVGPSAATERTLKQAVKSCLAQHGNLVDKLGDPKIVIREAARATLLDASTCSLSFISSLAHAPVDHPAQLIDKAIREHGFGSKNPRIRESSLQYLTSLRTSSTLRMEQLPTLKPYFQLLMHTLEDSDPTVREAAKESTVAIFSAPGLSDAARAELKKELGKGNVRKSTADHVLNKIFNGSSTSKDPPTQTDPDASEAPPPSMAGTSAGTVLPSEDVPPLYIASVRDLEGEFQQMLAPFEGKETEHNWQSRDRSIGKIRGSHVLSQDLRFCTEIRCRHVTGRCDLKVWRCLY